MIYITYTFSKSKNTPKTCPRCYLLNNGFFWQFWFFGFEFLSVCGLVFLFLSDFVLSAWWRAVFVTGEGGCLHCGVCVA